MANFLDNAIFVGAELKSSLEHLSMHLNTTSYIWTIRLFEPSCMEAADLLLLTERDAWALSPETLASAVQSDLQAGLIPFFLCANVGTTSTCAVDPLDKLGAVTQQYDIW